VQKLFKLRVPCVIGLTTTQPNLCLYCTPMSSSKKQYTTKHYIVITIELPKPLRVKWLLFFKPQIWEVETCRGSEFLPECEVSGQFRHMTKISLCSSSILQPLVWENLVLIHQQKEKASHIQHSRLIRHGARKTFHITG